MKLLDGKMLTRDEVVRKYRSLVYRYAHRYPGEFDTEDVAQDGFIGLLYAYDTYDPGKGLKFISYASANITFKIFEARRNQYKGVKYPNNIIEIANGIIKHGYEELDARHIAEKTGKPLRQVERALVFIAQREPFSMDGKHDEELTLHGVIGSPPVEDMLDLKLFMATLSDRERFIFRCLMAQHTKTATAQAIGISDQALSKWVKKIGRKYIDYYEGETMNGFTDLSTAVHADTAGL